MTLQIFLTGLLLVSILTSLVTEAIKRILEEQKKQYYSNTLAGIVAVVIAVLVDIGYTVLNNMAFRHCHRSGANHEPVIRGSRCCWSGYLSCTGADWSK